MMVVIMAFVGASVAMGGALLLHQGDASGAAMIGAAVFLAALNFSNAPLRF